MVAVAPDYSAEPETDPSNSILIQNVRAPGRAVPEPKDVYDLVVLGAGVAGLISCIVARQLGRSIAMVERHYTGGDCLNTGCVPSKALIAASRQAALARDSASYGVSTGEVTVDFAAVMSRMRRIRAEISEHDSVQRYSSQVGVDVFTGQARFCGKQAVQIDGGPVLHFRKCIIGTGASARVPAALQEVHHLTSANMWNLTCLPPRLVVVGSGPIGLEIAQAMQRLGSSVTIVSKSDRILGKEEPEAAQVVMTALERSGVTFLFGARIRNVHRSEGALYSEPFGLYSVKVVTASGDESLIEAEAILNATGRVPNVRGLDLDNAGVSFGLHGGINVNAHLQSSNPDIYAAGDCLSGPNQFTHAAEWEARIAVRNAFLGEELDAGHLLVPRATYTDPEVAAVGRTGDELRKEGVIFESFTRQVRDVDRNRCDGVDEGFATLHVAPDGKILGATIVASHAGDYISEVTLCMQHGLKASDLAGTMHPYPTGAEVVRQAAQAFVRSRIMKSESQALLQALSQPSPHIHQRRTEGDLLIVEIDRPRALNACDVVMARTISQIIHGFTARGVLLAGTGDRAFCSGGDVKSLALALREDAASPLPELQIAHEYRSIEVMHRLAETVPVIAIVDGICMGYGLGLAAAATYQVVTERSLIAMPECAIGIAPDAGFAAAAAELPPGVGLCMALTGWRLSGTEALAVGLVSHLVAQEELPRIKAALTELDWKGLDLAALLDERAPAPAAAAELDLADLLPHVEDIFATAPSVRAIHSQLSAFAENCSHPPLQRWAAERLQGLARGCPQAQMVAFQLLRAAEWDLTTYPGPQNQHRRLIRALERDYTATSSLLRRSDFLEGVRAGLIDKDGKPSWSCQLQDLTPNLVDAIMKSGQEINLGTGAD